MSRRKRGRRPRRKIEPERDLSQEMADLLIETPKLAQDPGVGVRFFPGMNFEIDYRGETESQELFRIIVERSEVNPRHAKYELLVRHSIVLLRFEIEGPAHHNPDHVRIACPHLHRYRAGFDDRWAEPAADLFGNTNDLLECLYGFLRYCNVVQVPLIRRDGGLFS